MTDKRKPLWPGNTFEETGGGLNFEGFYQRPPEESVDPRVTLQKDFVVMVNNMDETSLPLQKKWKAFVNSYQAIGIISA